MKFVKDDQQFLFKTMFANLEKHIGFIQDGDEKTLALEFLDHARDLVRLAIEEQKFYDLEERGLHYG